MRSFKTWSSRLLLAGLCLFAALGPARAAWSHVQGQHVADNNQSVNWTLTKAGSTIGTGNLIVGGITWGSGTTTDLTAVKVGTTSCTIVNRTADSANGQAFAGFACLNVAAAQTTITATGAAGGGALLMIWDEFTNTGVSTATADGSGAQVQPSPGIGTDTIKTGSTFGISGDLQFGFTVGDTNSGTLAAGTGYSTATADPADPIFFGISALSEFQTASGAADTTFTLSVTNGSYLTVGQAFTAGGGPPPSTCGSLPLLGAGC